MNVYFSDVFHVPEAELDRYGAFNISLLTDLPLFIDPFLLFNNSNSQYQALHDQIIRYLRFLRTKSQAGLPSPSLIRAWYAFSEVKQNWLGFCESSNVGRGLGIDFAGALNANMVNVFRDFGSERITRGTHLEKLCLIRSGVGRDMISDFTTNLIKDFLLEYTQTFAQTHIDPTMRRSVSISRAYFDYDLERWMPRTYDLPFFDSDYVLLTPKNILTKDETWINHSDMIRNFDDIPDAIENDQLRAQINNYFYARIPEDSTADDYAKAVGATLEEFPQLIDYYIKYKEQHGDEAVTDSSAKVLESTKLYVRQFGKLIHVLHQSTDFYQFLGNTKDETAQRIQFFKDVIENKGGHHIFYVNGQPLRRETDLHILFRLIWFATPSDVSREVNDGRGPADFKISRGAFDKTLVEFKLASNAQLKRNLEHQLEIYKKASDATAGFKVIVYFTESELLRVEGVLVALKMDKDPNIVLVDARLDNKPSGSKAV